MDAASDEHRYTYNISAIISFGAVSNVLTTVKYFVRVVVSRHCRHYATFNLSHIASMQAYYELPSPQQPLILSPFI